MTTDHADPWDGDDWTDFRRALVDATWEVQHGLQADTNVTADMLHQLAWRHWIIAFCARYASTFNASVGAMRMVECGVGDGLTAYFACREAMTLGPYEMHCYDAWAAMDDADLAPDEFHHRGGYGGSSLERTKRNLARFSPHVLMHPGHLPESLLTDPPGPDQVAFLSIDLNAAKPTLAVLEHFLPRLTSRAVIVIDDYGHRPYARTKDVVDAFLSDEPGLLLKLPTGQAMFLK